MKYPVLPAAKVAHVMESVAPGAFAWCTLCSSPAKIASVLLGLLGLAVVVHVAVPVLKALGVCWSVKIQARLMPSGRQRRRRDPNRTRERRTASNNVRHPHGPN
jgi:hypothetical protein